jgi:hypothetical protein
MIRRLLVLASALLVAALVWQPPPVMRAIHWVGYRVTGDLPPPLVVGRNGRVFLGNHPGDPAGSLIADVCGTGIGADTVGRAVGLVRPLLAAGRRTGVPFRLLIVPTAPRLYSEDLPASTPCADPAADRLVAALRDADVIYPVPAMEALKPRFDVLPRHHFHWAGEGPLRVAEVVGDDMGLSRSLTLGLRPDNRASDLRGFYPGMGLHDRIGTPFLKPAGVTQCTGPACDPPAPADVVVFRRPGPGRLLVIGDSFADEIGGDFSEYAGTVWLVRMNLALANPPALGGLHPDAIVAVYHDAGALALDPGSQASLALAARLVGEAGLPSAIPGR